MCVFGVFFGSRGVTGFNGCCSGASSGDGGFTLACISGRRGVIGFKVATSLCSMREIVRPAGSKWPEIDDLWCAGRVLSRTSPRKPRAGQVSSRIPARLPGITGDADASAHTAVGVLQH